MKWVKRVVPFLLGVSSAYGGELEKKEGVDRLVLAWAESPRTSDPRYAVDAYSQWLEELLHCSLLGFDPKGKLIPWLAEKWEWKTPTQLLVTLRKDAKFADGTLVSAEDVKQTFSYFLRKDLSVPSPRGGAFRGLVKVDTQGDQVTFHLKEPDASFLENLAVGVLPTRQIPASQTMPLDKPLLGCGPYVLQNQDMTHLVLRANPHYSLREKPKMAEVEIKIVKDENTHFSKLLKGEIDMSPKISLDKAKEISKSYPTLKVQKTLGLQTTYLGFNFQDPHLQKHSVRKAISHAINRDAIIQYLFHGMAQPATTLLLSSSPFYQADLKPIGYDLALAKKALDEAGYPQVGDKPRFSLTYKTTTNATRIAVAKAIASDLKKIGIDVSIQSLEWGSFKAEVDKGNIQMWSLDWVGFKGPGIYRYVFGSENMPPEGGNRGRYHNDKLDVLLRQAHGVTDFAEQKKLYDQIQTLVAEELPYVFLWHEETYMVLRSEVSGFEVYADGRYSALPRTTKAR